MSKACDTVAQIGPLETQNEPDSGSRWPLLAAEGMMKRYGAVLALNSVDFDVRSGEIHALLGENGAGKSTLMHLLTGLTTPDAGLTRWEGKPITLSSPARAIAAGISMVHQHFTLVPAFTVAENLALASPHRTHSWNYDPHLAAAPALERAEALGWPLNPDDRIADLPVGAQQRVEIVKALANKAKLLIFDEPTAVLSNDEIEELFTVLRRLRDEGCGVVLIAHKLSEVLRVADRVTVLRRGVKIASCPISETSLELLAEWMAGPSEAKPMDGPADAAFTPTEVAVLPDELPPTCTLSSSQTPVLSVNTIMVLGDRADEAIKGVSLQVAAGEIFGIGGVDGNGQAELAEALAGLRPIQSGELLWRGLPFQPRKAPSIGYIPQDRRRAGLAVTMSVEENLLFEAVNEPEYRVGPFLRRNKLRSLAERLIRQFDIRVNSSQEPALSLSGGNQQKIVAARALRSDPEWIVAVNPTRGLDIHATRFVHNQLRKARERGAAVLLISTDLDEIALLADRAGILSSGRLLEYDPSEIEAAELGLLLGGVSIGKAS